MTTKKVQKRVMTPCGPLPKSWNAKCPDIAKIYCAEVRGVTKNVSDLHSTDSRNVLEALWKLDRSMWNDMPKGVQRNARAALTRVVLSKAFIPARLRALNTLHEIYRSTKGSCHDDPMQSCNAPVVSPRYAALALFLGAEMLVRHILGNPGYFNAAMNIFKTCLAHRNRYPTMCKNEYVKLHTSQAPSIIAEMNAVAFSKTITKDKIERWLFQLRNYARSFERDDKKIHIPALRRALELQRAYVRINRPAGSQRAHRLFRRVIDVAFKATVLIEQGRNARTRNVILMSSFKDLHGAVLSDGRVSRYEKAVLRFMASIGMKSMLFHAERGFALPLGRRTAMHLRPSPYSFYLNRGERGPKRKDKAAWGHKRLSNFDERVLFRPTGGSCYNFALGIPVPSATAFTAPYYLRRYYRQVNPLYERARPGDLVAYMNPNADRRDLWRKRGVFRKRLAYPRFDILHMAIVESVDQHGFPLRAYGQFGGNGPIVSHPIDEAPLSYGILWGVFREKKNRKKILTAVRIRTLLRSLTQ